MSLAYKPSGPIPGYKPMSFYAGWAYMRGNRVQLFLLPCLSGLRTGYNTQHALVKLLEKFKICLDEGGKAGAILMDLSKAFDRIRHDCKK